MNLDYIRLGGVMPKGDQRRAVLLTLLNLLPASFSFLCIRFEDYFFGYIFFQVSLCYRSLGEVR